jgi:predicted phage tail protein
MNSRSELTKNSQQEKKILFPTVLRAVLLGAAFIATIWVIGALNSGNLFTGDHTTAKLLEIPAARSH